MKLLVLHKWLVAGGSEKILSSYLKILNQKIQQLDLIITYDLEEKNFFSPTSLNASTVQFVFHYPSHVSRQELLIQKRKKGLHHKFNYELFKLQEQLHYYKKIKDSIESNSYDAIIDFSGCLDKIIRNPFKLNLPPTIRWIHGQLNGDNPVTPKQKKKFRAIFQAHKQVVCICPQMAEIIQQQLCLPTEKLITVLNPIDLENICHQAQEDTVNLPSQPYLLQVSRLVQGKGHEDLIEIYAALKQRGIKHKLVFIGEGENRQNLVKQIRQLNLEDDCLLLGEIQNPYPFFRHATLFLHTSRHEGLPTVLLESMACGTPVVAMDCPTGPADILGRNNEYGKLIGLDDKTAFADTVAELLQDNELRAHYAKQALIRIQDFSLSKIGNELEQLLHNITGPNM